MILRTYLVLVLHDTHLEQPPVGENKVGSLNTGNYDVGSDDINQAVDTREIISHVKPDLLSRLKLVAAGAA